MDDEIWKIIDEAPNYQVSNHGRVQNRTTGRMLKYSPTNKGYPKVTLAKDGKYVQRVVHRLVATFFIPKIEGKPEVNHIDGNKNNPQSSNLEWVTHAENLKHAMKTGLVRKLRSWEVLPSGELQEIERK